MKFRNIAALLALSATLSACVSGDDSTPADSNPNAGFQARYAPLGGQMPFPNDLFSGKSGQLAIPGDATVAQNGPLLEMNHLDGFGTQSDISIYFTQPVDKTTIAANIFVLQVTSSPIDKHVTGFTKVLTPGTDYSIQLSPGIDSNGQIVTIKPLKPLAPSTVNATTHVPTFSTYMVIVTRGVKDASGANVSPSPDFSAIVAADTPAIGATSVDVTKIALPASSPLLPVAQFDLGQLAVAAGAGAKLDNIAVTFSFSTQFLNISLGELAATAAASDQTGTALVDTGETLCAILVASGQLPNAAACALVPGSTVTEIFAGDVALPYYSAVPSATAPTAALTGSWHNAKGGDIAISATDATSFLPKATVALNVIPALVAIPTGCGAMPGSGWPVAIFQHGITRNREDMLAIAGSISQACIATIAIDLPLHGVTDKTDPFYKNQLFTGTAAAPLFAKAVGERTFDMDLENNSTLAAGPDGKIDGSGAWFINLPSTITSRDNLREGAADLINLTASLGSLHPVTPPATLNAFDTSKVFYVGHSLGGIVGTTFLGADTASGAPKIVAASLAAPGGHIAELLRNSPSFEPIIDNGLAAQGLVKGTQSYYDFYSEAQAVVEDGDPANYAALAVLGHPIHMMEVVGGGNFGAGAGPTCNLPDQVVPNSATDLLAKLMGLTQVDTTSPGSKFITRFLAGDHGSVLSPTVPSSCTANTTNTQIYGAVTVEMQTEAVSFLAGGGTGLPVNNTPPIVQAP